MGDATAAQERPIDRLLRPALLGIQHTGLAFANVQLPGCGEILEDASTACSVAAAFQQSCERQRIDGIEQP